MQMPCYANELIGKKDMEECEKVLHWQISEHIEEGGMQEGMNLISI
jgi:hypothetical protein